MSTSYSTYHKNTTGSQPERETYPAWGCGRKGALASRRCEEVRYTLTDRPAEPHAFEKSVAPGVIPIGIRREYPDFEQNGLQWT